MRFGLREQRSVCLFRIPVSAQRLLAPRVLSKCTQYKGVRNFCIQLCDIMTLNLHGIYLHFWNLCGMNFSHYSIFIKFNNFSYFLLHYAAHSYFHLVILIRYKLIFHLQVSNDIVFQIDAGQINKFRKNRN